MIWIALQSALVQAHMLEESLHLLNHTVQFADDAIPDADQDGSCTVVVCSHPVGVLCSSSSLCWNKPSCSPPSTVLPLKSEHTPDAIERPKWHATAPGAAGM